MNCLQTRGHANRKGVGCRNLTETCLLIKFLSYFVYLGYWWCLKLIYCIYDMCQVSYLRLLSSLSL